MTHINQFIGLSMLLWDRFKLFYLLHINRGRAGRLNFKLCSACMQLASTTAPLSHGGVSTTGFSDLTVNMHHWETWNMRTESVCVMVHYKQYKAISDFFSYSTIQSQLMRTFEIWYRTKTPCTLLTLQIFKKMFLIRGSGLKWPHPRQNLNS